MKLSLRGTVAIVLLCATNINAQIRFEKGFVVTNAGDTVRGFIKVWESANNPHGIQFKVSPESEPVTYTTDDLSYFSVMGSHFQRFDIGITMHSVELRKAPAFEIPPAVKRPLFLKLIHKGATASLYSYQDKLKLRFFLAHAWNNYQPDELIYRIIKSAADFVEVYSYRDMLTFVAEKAGVMNEQLQGRIKHADYREREILYIVNRINNDKKIKVRIENKASTGFRVGAGVTQSMLHHYSGGELEKNSASTASPGYWFSVGYDLAKNPVAGNLVVRFEIAFSKSENGSTTYDHRYSSKWDFDYRFTQKTYGVSGSALYNFHNTKKLKIFGSAGVGLNYSEYDVLYLTKRESAGTVDLFEEDSMEPRAVWSIIPIKVGVVLLDKFEFGVRYCPARPLQVDNLPYKFKISTVQTGLIYHF